MKVGDMVMLIGCDNFMPPCGVVGTIIRPFDGEDFAVDFPSYPCPVESPEWYVPPQWLMVIPPPESTRQCEMPLGVFV